MDVFCDRLLHALAQLFNTRESHVTEDLVIA